VHPLVELISIGKSFPGVTALAAVTLELLPGRIHALVGENGAGKSTLLNILAGSLQPDSGELRLDGKAVRFAGAFDARRAGIVIVHQEVDLFSELSVAENVGLLTGLPNRFGWINWREQTRRTRAALAAVHEAIEPRTPAGELSPAQRQMVEVAAAISQAARVLVLDEPTSSLSAAEAQTLFGHLRRFRDHGTAIVYVSHRLDEIFALADEVTVLRDGRRVWHGPIGDTSPADLIRKMVGRDSAVIARDPFSGKPKAPAPDAGAFGLPLNGTAARLRCEGITARDGSCADVALAVCGGEVLGLYGLIGAGRSEWAQVVLGLRPGSGKVWIDGEPVSAAGPAALATRGLVYVPEDRLHQGLCRGLSVRANAVLASLHQLGRLLFVSPWREALMARLVVDRLDVRRSSIEQRAGTLSGGNQQKLVLGRWLARDPAVLILDEPTRGVDVGAKAEIHADVRRLAASGRAVVLISSDLPEVLTNSDRVGVFRQGRIVRVFERGVTPEELAAAALPLTADPSPPALRQ
jgi:rhamnose transport system ATP-binding protein